MVEWLWGEGILIHCWLGSKVVQPLYKSGLKSLRKLEIEQVYDPALELLGKPPRTLHRTSETLGSPCSSLLYLQELEQRTSLDVH